MQATIKVTAVANRKSKRSALQYFRHKIADAIGRTSGKRVSKKFTVDIHNFQAYAPPIEANKWRK
jgi:hypothetical protein